MAGYVTKLVGHVYDGAHFAGEELEIGMFVEIAEDGTVKKVTAAKDTILRVAPDGKEDLWGMNALRLDVVSVGDDEVYFLENEWDVNDAAQYDTAQYAVEAGNPVKMKRLLPGEQVIMSVAGTLFTTLEVNDAVQPASGGTVAAVTGG